MSDAPTSNRPRYSPLQPDPRARAHLLVCDDAQVPGAALAEGLAVAAFPERWLVAPPLTSGERMAMPAPLAGPGEQLFRSSSHLLSLLRHRLAAETMGLRLYAVGAESFVWDVAGIAMAAGMGRDEFRLFAHGPHVRRVHCVHCRTLNTGVTTSLVTCAGCGATLHVRDHFSRVHNAYMGVQVDAEVPGELPPVEELS